MFKLTKFTTHSYKLILIVFLLSISFFNVLRAEEITILYTTDINGNIKSCLCPKNNKGGLQKLHTLIKQERQKYPNAFLLDSGDTSEQNKDMLGFKYLLKALRLLKYDAVGIGANEIRKLNSNGIDFIKKNRLLREIKKTPFISAVDLSAFPLDSPKSVLINKNVKIAVLN
ncbi:hypothetical protein ACFLZV_07000, partial [Candidatus Margulisiibacteriota bacterium]